jgi:hypothetical protein
VIHVLGRMNLVETLVLHWIMIHFNIVV